MKKHHPPQYPITQEALEQQLKKLKKVEETPHSTRGATRVQHPPHSEKFVQAKVNEETSQVEVDAGEPSGVYRSEKAVQTEGDTEKPNSVYRSEKAVQTESDIEKPNSVYRSEKAIQTEGDTGKSNTKRLSEKTLGADAAASQSKTLEPLTEKQLALELQKSQTIQNNEGDIRWLCQVVYGNPGALDLQLSSIMINPKVGIPLSWSLIEKPTMVGRLAGYKICGIKSPARRRAEENLNDLCAIFQKHVWDTQDIVSAIEKSDYREHRNFLSKGQFVKKLQANLEIQECTENIRQLCEIVYGSPDALNVELEKVLRNPEIEARLSRSLFEKSKAANNLAGFEVCGIKTPKRQEAEQCLPYLRAYFSEYITKTKALSEEMQQPDCVEQQKTLTGKQLAQKLKENIIVQNSEENIRHLCQIVYGKSDTLNIYLNKILHNPEKVTHLPWCLAEHSQSFNKLAGHEICGIKNSTRRQAEEDIVNLRSSFEEHVQNIRRLAAEIKKPDYVEHKELQRRGAVRHHHPTKEKQQAVGEDVRPRKQVCKQALAM